MNRKEIIEMAYESIIEADEDKAMTAMDIGAEEGIGSVELLNEGFSQGMSELGNRFATGEIFLPDLMFSSEVMKAATDRIEKEMSGSSEQIEKTGTIVMATVEGDVHDIGKGICCSMLKASGFDVVDLGREVPVEAIIKAAEEHNADIIGTSALLTTTMTEQQKLEEALRKQNLRDKYKTMIGGAPVTEKWSEKIGANMYAEDSSECVEKAKGLIKE